MSDKTRIEWTDATWNPVTGCTKVSGVAYHFKQWGEWAPIKRPFDYVTNDDRVQVVSADGERLGRPWRGWALTTSGAEVMRRYGKKAAGRELDGRTWDEYPEAPR